MLPQPSANSLCRTEVAALIRQTEGPVHGTGKGAGLALLVLFLVVFLLTGPVAVICAAGDTANHYALYVIDYTSITGEATQWLLHHGFNLKKDMESSRSISLSGSPERGLVIETQKPALGLALKEDLHVEDVGAIEIQWGVLQYPQGAAWNKGINREPLMITLFFGSRVKADHFFLPDSPCFLGLFLGGQEDHGQVFVGKSYKKTGRYMCIGAPKPGKIITSTIDLAAAYRKVFKTTTVPPLTGLGIEVDTSDLDDGRSRSFLKKIVFYKSTPEGESNVYRR